MTCRGGRLAHLHAIGKGVATDGATALRLYASAAEKGDAFAQLQFGLRYAKGEGVVQNYVQAHKWVNLAAAKGDGEAAKSRDLRQADDARTRSPRRIVWRANGATKARRQIAMPIAGASRSSSDRDYRLRRCWCGPER